MEQLTKQAIKELRYICPDGIEQNVLLAELSQWRIGGNADVIIRPSNTKELGALRAWFYEHNIQHIVIGATSNLLFSDEGLKVPCIQIGNRMSGIAVEDQIVTVKAGTWVPSLARTLMQAGLTGGEHICGIPGTFGGLICMNGGSQRKGIGNNVISVESVNAQGIIVNRKVSECQFDYRDSIFQQEKEVVSSATLQYASGSRSGIRREMLKILADRGRKFPRKQPNCGSVFKSNPIMYDNVGTPGFIIEKMGFKGIQIGGAIVSPLHANFIINTGNAKAKDVLDIISKISNEVFLNTGYRIEAESLYVSPCGRILPADEALN